jgi:hypothetical protein
MKNAIIIYFIHIVLFFFAGCSDSSNNPSSGNTGSSWFNDSIPHWLYPKQDTLIIDTNASGPWGTTFILPHIWSKPHPFISNLKYTITFHHVNYWNTYWATTRDTFYNMPMYFLNHSQWQWLDIPIYVTVEFIDTVNFIQGISDTLKYRYEWRP